MIPYCVESEFVLCFNRRKFRLKIDLKFYHFDIQVSQLIIAMSSEKLKGVICLCDGENRKNKENIFKTIEIDPNHPIFTQGELSPVAEKLGFELLALQIPSDDEALCGEDLQNQVSTCNKFLNIYIV